mmetsp:Transcript_45969/g.79357  ORF Transcript_45969/g.79357 Transcript_45969/m.79357 type:complete len:108 (-) Transcript_45969:731-1054(-)
MWLGYSDNRLCDDLCFTEDHEMTVGSSEEDSLDSDDDDDGNHPYRNAAVMNQIANIVKKVYFLLKVSEGYLSSEPSMKEAASCLPGKMGLFRNKTLGVLNTNTRRHK